MTGKELFLLSENTIVSNRVLFDTIVKSKDPSKDQWAGKEYVINNTPMQGINWIGDNECPKAVIIRSNGKNYRDDSGLEYALKAKNGVVDRSEKANRVLVNQPRYNYPILYFLKEKKRYRLLGRFAVAEVREKSVVLKRLEPSVNYSEYIPSINDKTNLLEALNMQKIFFGAPGTGKSHKIDASEVEGGLGLKDVPENRKFRTTFHPDYDYAQFVGCYKPLSKKRASSVLDKDELKSLANTFINDKANEGFSLCKFSALYSESLEGLVSADRRYIVCDAAIGKTKKDEPISDDTLSALVNNGIAVGNLLKSKLVPNEGSITYSFSPQVFANAYVAAYKNPSRPVYLVIEEINRGNCAQIFGDIFQLLDRDDEGYSRYEIDADADFAEWLESQIPDQVRNDGKVKLRLPPNFNILATMNTSDQSLFPMDCAFKRRFDWEYVPIAFKNDDGSEKSAARFEVEVGNEKYRWQTFVENVNKKIEDLTESEDKQLGEYFIQPDKKAKDDDAEKTVISEDRFKGKVMFYLWNEVCKDEHKNGSFFKVDGKYFTFQELYKDPSKLSAFMKEMTKTSAAENSEK